MKKSCDNCKHKGTHIKCSTCVEEFDAPLENWEPIEDEQKPQTGYAVIPMDEYLFLFTQIKDLEVEYAGLKAELETTKRFLSEATDDLANAVKEVEELQKQFWNGWGGTIGSR